MKQLIASLVPDARWLVEELPSPPLVPMMKHYLPDLPIRAPVEREHRCPRHLRSALQTAIEERNDVVHRGLSPTADLRNTLTRIREFLYLLDFYGGHEWAVAKLSEETRASLAISEGS